MKVESYVMATDVERQSSLLWLIGQIVIYFSNLNKKVAEIMNVLLCQNWKKLINTHSCVSDVKYGTGK